MPNYVDELVPVIAGHVPLAPDEVRELLEVPPDPRLGDYAFPCFRLAKELRKAPATIADELAAQVRADGLPASYTSVESVGPFVNFTIDPARRARFVLESVRALGDAYGGADHGAGHTIVVDYSSPNIAKPFGIGHLRSTTIGAALCRIYRALGWRVVGVNHIGDWGTQFGKLIVAFRRWGRGGAAAQGVRDLYDLYVRFHKAAETEPALDDEARAWHKRFEDSDPEALELWRGFREASLADFRRIYEVLGVEFDSWNGESFYLPRLDDTIRLAVESGVAVEDQGALIVDLQPYGLGVCLLRKSDGTSLYPTRDLAAIIYRAEEYKFDRLLYVVGTPQSQHFAQLFMTAELLGYDWARECVHVNFGHILGMSTRKGTIVFLEDVLAQAAERAAEIIAERNPDIDDPERAAREVGVGAIVFADLSRRRVRDYTFDWDEILNFDGETGPYVQYTHARLCSILRKYEREIPLEFAADRLDTPEELACVRSLEGFPAAVRQAAEDYEPSLVASHLIDLATAANAFYQRHRVVGCGDPDVEAARVALVDAMRQTLRNGLRLIGIAALERM